MAGLWLCRHRAHPRRVRSRVIRRAGTHLPAALQHGSCSRGHGQRGQGAQDRQQVPPRRPGGLPGAQLLRRGGQRSTRVAPPGRVPAHNGPPLGPDRHRGPDTDALATRNPDGPHVIARAGHHAGSSRILRGVRCRLPPAVSPDSAALPVSTAGGRGRSPAPGRAAAGHHRERGPLTANAESHVAVTLSASCLPASMEALPKPGYVWP